jgi:hypothetical protein
MKVFAHDPETLLGELRRIGGSMFGLSPEPAARLLAWLRRAA